MGTRLMAKLTTRTAERVAAAPGECRVECPIMKKRGYPENLCPCDRAREREAFESASGVSCSDGDICHVEKHEPLNS